MPGRERLTDGHQLVTGGEERDHGFALDLQAGNTERCQHAEIGRGEACAGLDHDLTLLHVLAGLANVLADAVIAVDANLAVVADLDLFLHHHRVGALRQQRAGHDPHALAALDPALPSKGTPA